MKLRLVIHLCLKNKLTLTVSVSICGMYENAEVIVITIIKPGQM